jgi:hypothetical protein
MTSLLMCLVRLYSHVICLIWQTITPAYTYSTGHIEISKVVSLWLKHPGGRKHYSGMITQQYTGFLAPIKIEDHSQDNDTILLVII